MKQIKILFPCIAIIISSCSTQKQDIEWVCDCDQQKKVAEFITANAKASNNMSDEEMEDVISELRKSGVRTHCKQRLMWQFGNGNINWEKEKLDSCEVWIDTRYGE